MYIPDGFNTVTPYLFVSGADTFVEFLKKAFDGEELGRSIRPDGKIANAQVRIGSSTVMVSEAPEQYKSMRSSYYLYVEDADIAMEKAIENGAKLEMAVDNMPYGDRQGGVVDPFGNIWWLSQRLESKPYF
ncbi:MAG: VOC family protein [Pseudomonadales bacterium]|nr:VOC family protein [Pseudomonadales bacterium]